jgi:hypothetical protein
MICGMKAAIGTLANLLFIGVGGNAGQASDHKNRISQANWEADVAQQGGYSPIKVKNKVSTGCDGQGLLDSLGSSHVLTGQSLGPSQSQEASRARIVTMSAMTVAGQAPALLPVFGH